MKKKLLEYKIKNRYLIYMILFSYCMGSFLGIFVHNVNATFTGTKYEFFDTYADGSQITTGSNVGLITSTNWGSGYRVTNALSNSPPNSYKITSSTGVYCHWNFTTDSGRISEIRFKMKVTLGLAADSIMYVSLNNSETYLSKIKFWFDDTTTDVLRISDATTGDYLANITSTAWQNFKINFSNTGEFILSIENNSIWLSLTSTPTGSIHNFNKIYWGSGTANQGSLNIDDLEVDFNYGELSGIICGYDMTSYNQRGDLSPYYFDDINSKNIYENFKTPISTTVTGVSLSCNQAQYADDSNLNNYYLIFNGVNYSSPDCFYLSDFGTRVLFWKTDRVIVNETLSFQFTHTQKTGFRYWLVGEGGNRDLDLDGDILSGYSTFLYEECHWEWFSWFPIPFYVCTDVWGYENQFDLSYNFYYTTIETPNTYNYTDSLGLHGYSYKNSTGYVYDINTPNGIIGSYLINDRAYSYSIEIYKNGSYFNTTGYPYLCNYPSGSFGLTPTTIGKYQFKLKKVGYVDNITAYVIGTLSNFYVSTNPPITNQFDSYDIYYRFFHPQSYNGSLDKFNVLEYINNHVQSTFSSDITTNTTGTINYFSSSSSAEYWRLFVNRNGFYSPVGNLATHYIRLPSVVDNTINIEPKAITIVYNNPENKTIYISGQHTFPGCDIGVYSNGVLVSKVGGNQNYGVFYAPKYSGVYTIDLRLLQNNTLTVVAISPYQLTVTVLAEEEEEHGLLEAPYTYIAGTILTLVCLILPVIAVGKLNIQSDIMKYVPIFSGMLGFILSCLVGFFPWYAIFGLILVLVVVLLVIHKSKE